MIFWAFEEGWKAQFDQVRLTWKCSQRIIERGRTWDLLCFHEPVKIGIAPLCCGGAGTAAVAHSEAVDMILIMRISERTLFSPNKWRISLVCTLKGM